MLSQIYNEIIKNIDYMSVNTKVKIENNKAILHYNNKNYILNININKYFPLFDSNNEYFINVTFSITEFGSYISIYKIHDLINNIYDPIKLYTNHLIGVNYIHISNDNIIYIIMNNGIYFYSFSNFIGFENINFKFNNCICKFNNKELIIQNISSKKIKIINLNKEIYNSYKFFIIDDILHFYNENEIYNCGK